MSEEHGKPAWSDESEAVLVAIKSQLDELPTYEHKMNVIVNALRSVMTTEAARGVKEATGKPWVELPHLIMALEILVKEFVEQYQTMPKRLKDVVHAETGCGTCDICQQAKRDAYADGRAIPRPASSAAREAIEQLIATMRGGSSN